MRIRRFLARQLPIRPERGDARFGPAAVEESRRALARHDHQIEEWRQHADYRLDAALELDIRLRAAHRR
jgi:hypothetical protein